MADATADLFANMTERPPFLFGTAPQSLFPTVLKKQNGMLAFFVFPYVASDVIPKNVESTRRKARLF